jgi:hypothetical protein
LYNIIEGWRSGMKHPSIHARKKSSQSTWYQSWRVCLGLTGGESVPVLSSLCGEVGRRMHWVCWIGAERKEE